MYGTPFRYLQIVYLKARKAKEEKKARKKAKRFPGGQGAAKKATSDGDDGEEDDGKTNIAGLNLIKDRITRVEEALHITSKVAKMGILKVASEVQGGKGLPGDKNDANDVMSFEGKTMKNWLGSLESHPATIRSSLAPIEGLLGHPTTLDANGMHETDSQVWDRNEKSPPCVVHAYYVYCVRVCVHYCVVLNVSLLCVFLLCLPYYPVSCLTRTVS